jgi:hypothetical protein
MKTLSIVTICLSLLMLTACSDKVEVPSDGPAKEPAKEPVKLPANGNDAPKKSGPGTITINEEVIPSILFEAESGKIEAPMKVFEDKTVSGGKYILAPENPDHTELSKGGQVTHKFIVAEAGEYTLFLRTNFCCSCGDSFDLKLDGVMIGTIQDSTIGKWHWAAFTARKLKLKAGKHYLTIINREDGASYDQVLLTQDDDASPAGKETLDKPGRTSGAASASPK